MAIAGEWTITPMGLPAGVPLVLVLGGSFDPPHRAHVTLPARVRDELERRAGFAGRAWLAYVPAARSPLKQNSPVASDADRTAMLRLAIADMPRSLAWTDEIERAGLGRGPGGIVSPSYTVETLRRARAWLDSHGSAGAALRLLIGADQAAQFHHWKGPRDIIALAEPVVMLRAAMPAPGRPSPDRRDDLAAFRESMHRAGAWSPQELSRWENRVIVVGTDEASSTEVRSLLADPRANPDCRARLAQLLDPRVLAYIDQHALYRSPGGPASP
jgi:nicotinate-nucleotide adenylyltransferase